MQGLVANRTALEDRLVHVREPIATGVVHATVGDIRTVIDRAYRRAGGCSPPRHPRGRIFGICGRPAEVGHLELRANVLVLATLRSDFDDNVNLLAPARQ